MSDPTPAFIIEVEQQLVAAGIVKPVNPASMADLVKPRHGLPKHRRAQLDQREFEQEEYVARRLLY